MSIKVTTSTIVEREDGFLLVQEGSDPKRRFNLPGGGQKKRESPMEAAIRETEEETGLEVTLDYLVGIPFTRREASRNNLTRFVFKATEVGGDVRPSEHHPVVDFFSFKEIKKMDEAGQISSAQILAAIKRYRKGGSEISLSSFIELPNVKRKLLVPKGLVTLGEENVDL
jgi:8-oxo-dGTP pyrophosphatase MutT (NUDIX family)